MADAGTVIVNINGNDSGLSAALKRATNRIAAFGQTINGRITEGLVDPTKKAKIQFKDVSRIVGGIIISKIFYSGLNAIRNATAATREFCEELEYTQLAFSQLFKSTDLAAEFVNVLKDFSAVSPFSFSDSSKAAQRLLAYGIQYKNVMYVMQGVLDAATMQGDSSKIEAVSRALGQIYTKGTLKAEELRQLAEAGIPAYEILREKLQLTEEAMQNIGKAGIPASVAINALVDGIHERFAGMTKDSAKTMKGMWSNIKDNYLMMMQNFLDPLYQKARTVVHILDQFVDKLREISDVKGLGGVFEYLVPDKQLQSELRQFVAILKEIGQILGYGLKTALITIRGLLVGFVHVFNTLGPVLVSIGQIISLVVRELSKCKPLMTALAYLLTFNVAAWIAFRTAALGALILKPVTQLILLCARSLGVLATLLVSHPLIGGLLILTGAVTALGLAHSKAGQQIKEFFSKLTEWNGIDPGTQILPDTKKRTADIEKFNERLDQTKDALGATGDAAEDAAKKGKKAQKDLLFFDEVFRLTQNDATDADEIETPDWDLSDDWGDWDIADSGESLLPDFQELIGGAFEKQLDKLKDKIKSLWEKFKNILPGILTGAGLGTILGNLIGGPLGGILGAIAGSIVGFFWSKLAQLIGVNDQWHAAIAGGILAGFLALVATVTGLGPIGAVLATMAGFFGGIFWEKIAEAFGADAAMKKEAAISSAIGAGIGAILGYLIGGPVGAIIGGFAGTFVGELWSLIADKVGSTGFDKIKDLLVAAFTGLISGVAAAIPSLCNGLTTALVNGIGIGLLSMVASLAASGLSNILLKWLSDELNLTEQDVKYGKVGKQVGGICGSVTGAIVGFFLGGPVGAAIGAAVGNGIGQPLGTAIGAIWGKNIEPALTSIGNGMKTFFTSTLPKFFTETIPTVFTSIISGLWNGLLNALGSLHEWFDAAMSSLVQRAKDIFGIASPSTVFEYIGYNVVLGLLAGIQAAWVGFTEFIAGLFTAFIELFKTGFIAVISDAIISFCGGSIESISAWATTTIGNFTNWFDNVKQGFLGFVTNTQQTIISWTSTLKQKINDWTSNSIVNIRAFATQSASNISSFVTQSSTRISSFVSTSSARIASWVSQTVSRVSNWSSQTLSKISDWVSQTLSNISNWSSMSLSIAGQWASNFASRVANGCQNALNNISSFISDATSRLQSWASSMASTISSVLSSAASAASSALSYAGSSISSFLSGHASGGVFDREHIARVSEGNKAEAIIPLENQSAMQPFVDAVASGLAQYLGPVLANMHQAQPSYAGVDNSMPPLYVGTLIADDSGLRELERKMQIIRLKETRRTN